MLVIEQQNWQCRVFNFLGFRLYHPSRYLKEIDIFFPNIRILLFLGGDAASADFTDLQKAINFSMTSFLTTGGIRGGKASVTSYQPRGFNMGMSSALFKQVGGYDQDFVCGEDVESSIRLQKRVPLVVFPEAHVYQKRRATLKQFRRQVFRFGAARPLLAKAHPGI